MHVCVCTTSELGFCLSLDGATVAGARVAAAGREGDVASCKSAVGELEGSRLVAARETE